MSRILSSGRKYQPAGYRNEIRAYPQFMLLVVREGELWIEQDGTREIARPTRIILLTPGVDVTLSSPRTGYRGWYVEGVAADCTIASGCHRIGIDSALQRVCGEIDNELSRPASDDLAGVLLHSVWLRCLRRCTAQSVDDVVTHVDRLLEQNRYGDQRLDALLASLPYSRRHLERLYGAARGHSIKQHLLHLRIEEAKRLLAHGRSSVTTVAFELGFASSQHFATVFRRMVGCTPSSFMAQA